MNDSKFEELQKNVDRLIVAGKGYALMNKLGEVLHTDEDGSVYMTENVESLLTPVAELMDEYPNFFPKQGFKSWKSVLKSKEGLEEEVHKQLSMMLRAVQRGIAGIIRETFGGDDEEMIGEASRFITQRAKVIVQTAGGDDDDVETLSRDIELTARNLLNEAQINFES